LQHQGRARLGDCSPSSLPSSFGPWGWSGGDGDAAYDGRRRRRRRGRDGGRDGRDGPSDVAAGDGDDAESGEWEGREGGREGEREKGCGCLYVSLPYVFLLLFFFSSLTSFPPFLLSLP